MEASDVYTGLERWLVYQRDKYSVERAHAWWAIDSLLDQVRDAGAEGMFPWDRMVDE